MLRRLVVATGSTIAALLLVVGTATAQTGVLSGAVFANDSRVGVEGATITIVGTTLTAVTGKDGRFTIANVPGGDHELRIRRTEFAARNDRVRVAVGDTTHAYYELIKPGASVEKPTHDEVVADFEAISGRVAGSRIAIRTPATAVDKAPLFIIDGVIMSESFDMKEFDANVIQSVEVVKGEAATKLYGSRAADGVIHITTKPAAAKSRPPQP